MAIRKRETTGKKQIMRLLENSTAALSQDMLESNPELEMDRVTIYRILNSFAEDGKVHRIVGNDGKAYYARCRDCATQEAHHLHKHLHFQCVTCHRVECLPTEIVVPQPKGYVVDAVNIVLSGTCRVCSKLG